MDHSWLAGEHWRGDLFVVSRGRRTIARALSGLLAWAVGRRHLHSLSFYLRRIQYVSFDTSTAGFCINGCGYCDGFAVGGALQRVGYRDPGADRRVSHSDTSFDWRG